MISVIVPTVAGRSHWLDRCVKSYKRFHPDAQITVVFGRSSCGEAWAVGAEDARGEILHFTCDDIELDNPLDEAIRVARGGKIPSPVVLNADRSVQSIGGVFGDGYPADGVSCPFTTLPLVTRAMYDRMGTVPAIHYSSDQWFTTRGAAFGWPTVACHGYRVVHHMAPEGRLDSQYEDSIRLTGALG